MTNTNANLKALKEGEPMENAESDFKAQHVRFTDNKGALLEILAKRMKDGTYQCLAYHTPKGGKRQRGCVGSFSDADAVTKRFSALCTEAEKAKWRRKVRVSKGVNAFDAIPKAAV